MSKVPHDWTISSAPYIFGTDKIDVIFGGDGAQHIYGRGDSDFIYGRFGNDILFGEDGNDILHGEDGFDILFGGDGDDDLIGGPGRSHIYGGDGRDYIAIGGRSKQGPSVVVGGEGKDEFLFIPAYYNKTVRVHLHDYEVGEMIGLGVYYGTIQDNGVSPEDVRLKFDKLIFEYSDAFGDHKLVVQGVGNDLREQYGSVQAAFDADALAFQMVGH